MATKSNTTRKNSKAAPKTSDQRATARRKWTVRFLAVVFSLILAEAMLRVMCYLSPNVDLALSPPSKYKSLTLVVPDNKLRFRGDPRYAAEHDALGFRNPQLRQIPESSTVVAIGDSQTYGTSVDWREAWPQQFERQSGLSTYNMGCSSWGPIQYREILNDALKLKPKLVLIGFYFGNDLFDGYRDSYFLPTGADLCDPKQNEAIQELERRDPFLARVEKLYKATMAPEDDPNSSANSPPADEVIDRYGKLSALIQASWKVVSGLNRRSEDEQWKNILSWASKRPDDLFVVDGGKYRTVLTPSYRGAAVDFDDLRIREGERIALTAIQQISDRCREAGCKLLVVLIPTKEMVYSGVAGDAVQRPDYSRLLAHEQQASDRTKAFLEQHGIPFVETLQPLEQCFTSHLNPYLPSADGHPSGFGQRAVAIATSSHPLVKDLE